MLTTTDLLANIKPPLKVFIVEDSFLLASLLMDLLNVPDEIEIVGASDTESGALKFVDKVEIDAIVVDLALKEGSGFNVIKGIVTNKSVKKPKIIVFSNQSNPEVRKYAINLGADYFFDKSSDYENLKCTLQDIYINQPEKVSN